MRRRLLLVTALPVIFANLGAAQECPPGPNKVTVEVEANVTYSPKDKLYTYSYTLTSSPASLQIVDGFAVHAWGAGLASAIAGPTDWLGRSTLTGYTMKWTPMEAEPLPPGAGDDGSMPAPRYGLKPGATLSGFSFKSRFKPGPRPYYVSGFSPVPAQATEEEAETFLERCPEFGKDFFQSSVLGSVLGPAPDNVGTMQIDILPGNPNNNFDPRAAGTIEVAILSTKQFDALSVNPNKLTFGRGFAPALSWSQQDVNNDGKADLVLVFDIPATQTACQDVAAFLRVNTFDGGTLWGSDSIQTGCR